jgi:ankyrin repeat protein
VRKTWRHKGPQGPARTRQRSKREGRRRLDATSLGRPARYLGIVRLLISFKASVNTKDTLGFTALVIATGEGHNTVVRTLLRAGASPNTTVRMNSHGTALHLASSWNRFAVVKSLVELSRVRINARDREGMTPLGYAMDGRFKKLATYLVEHGAIR